MDIAALIAWVVTAGGGFVLLGTWIARGGPRQAQAGASRFPPALIFGHFALVIGIDGVHDLIRFFRHRVTE